MQSEGLKRYYENDVAFSLMVRTIPALAFVPPDRVVETYEALEELMPNEMLSLLDYFERTYIGRRIGNQRREPMFKIFGTFILVLGTMIQELLIRLKGFSNPTIWNL